MNRNDLEMLCGQIQPVDPSLRPALQRHIDRLTKPPGSLGRLEELAVRYALARHTLKPQLRKKRILTFAGDHGVAAEGVSAYPASVTPQMVLNMLGGGAAINVLARCADAEHCVVDVGVNFDFQNVAGLVHRKIRAGTRNFCREPAMTLDETMAALTVGLDLAAAAARENVDLLAIGEMGIANTTSAAALMAVLLPGSVKDVTGRGTGVDDARLQHKIEVLERAVRRYTDASDDPIAILAALGGLEIAAMSGAIFGAAAHRLPVVVDGFIASAAALVAVKMAPVVKDYLFHSHQSAEVGHARYFIQSGDSPVLNLQLRLGEGTGAALAIPLIEAAVRIFNEMATFESAAVDGSI